MARFLTLFQYTPEATAALVKNPEDRSQPVREIMQQSGGQLLDFYFCFGEYDGVIHFEAPDQITAQAVIHAIIAAGHIKHERTMNLQTVDEKMQVLRKAGQFSYRPPSGFGMTAS